MKRNFLFVLVMAVTSICSGQWLERQVVLGDTFGGISLEGGIVVNPISGNVYIESDPIQIFNPVTMEKLRGPGTDGSVVFCPPSGKGYVLRESLVIIDAAADTVIGSTMLPLGPDECVYSRTSNRLYLAHTPETVLCVFDPDGDSILRTIDVGFKIEALQWDTVWNRVYVCGISDTAPELRAWDCVGDTLSPAIQTGLYNVHSFALSTASHKLYCVGEDTNEVDAIAVISTDSLKSLGTLPGLPNTEILAYSPATDRLYGVDGDYMYILDCRSDTIRGTRNLDVDISALALSSLTGRVYLGLYDTALVLVMDTTDSVIGSIVPPTRATNDVEALTFSPDRNELFGMTSGAVAFVVDASVDTISGAVSYATVSATRMLHNPAGNKLYVLCPDQDEVLVFDSTFGTPKHIPGGVYNASGVPILNPALNRIYMADGSRLRVIDCNSDSLLGNRIMYGISPAIPVMVPYLNKLYVFSGGGTGDSAYVYDCLRDTVASVFHLTSYVPCAVYDPRSNRVLFACHDAPTIRALDPATDLVVKTFNLVGGSYRGRMALNVDLGRLYFTDQTAKRMFTMDLLTDSVIASESLPWNVEAMFLNRRRGKLYMCSQDTARVLVFDCGRGTVVDTISASYRYAGLMDDISDKLYLRYGAVVDCRNDSVVTRLDSITARSMAWDMVDNRVFMAPTSRIYVYRDNPYGITDRQVGFREQRHATIVRGVLFLPQASGVKRGASSMLLDISGRKVLELRAGPNDVRMLPAGVYFIRSGPSAVSRQPSAVTKVVIQR